jgi:hypothetical protein
LPTPQEVFDSKYVATPEICVDLGVTRSSVFNRRKAGGLPGAIEVRTRDGSIHLLIWVRKEVSPHLERWRAQLKKRTA